MYLRLPLLLIITALLLLQPGSAQDGGARIVVATRVKEIVEAAAQSSRTKTEKTSVITKPLLVPQEHLDEIKSLGDEAVPPLVRHAFKGETLEKEVAVRFLGLLATENGSGIAADALADVALKAPEAVIRARALPWASHLPGDRGRALLEKVAREDADSRVRDQARRELARMKKRNAPE